MKENSIAVIGLGYVGMALAEQAQQHYTVIGFDVSKKRIEALKKHHDIYAEYDANELASSKIHLTTEVASIADATIYIITVQTPLDKHNLPDLRALKLACETVSPYLNKDDLVIIESTVYPGTCEEIALPILEKNANGEFYFGYSPERVNPADHDHTFANTPKIVSGIDAASLGRVNAFYERILKAPTHRAPNIKVAEAAKLLENIQRDVNIALMNEAAEIFNAMGIHTQAVLEASKTKWNFLPFNPGLVGGHCIPIDPVYLTERAKEFGVEAKLISTARDINSQLPQTILRAILAKMGSLEGKQVLIFGLSYKKNCSDMRTSLVPYLIRLLDQHGARVFANDPILDKAWLGAQTRYTLIDSSTHLKEVDGVIYAVDHDYFSSDYLASWQTCLKKPVCVFDLTGCLDQEQFKDSEFWQL